MQYHTFSRVYPLCAPILYAFTLCPTICVPYVALQTLRPHFAPQILRLHTLRPNILRYQYINSLINSAYKYSFEI